MNNYYEGLSHALFSKQQPTKEQCGAHHFSLVVCYLVLTSIISLLFPSQKASHFTFIWYVPCYRSGTVRLNSHKDTGHKSSQDSIVMKSYNTLNALIVIFYYLQIGNYFNMQGWDNTNIAGSRSWCLDKGCQASCADQIPPKEYIFIPGDFIVVATAPIHVKWVLTILSTNLKCLCFDSFLKRHGGK